MSKSRRTKKEQFILRLIDIHTNTQEQECEVIESTIYSQEIKDILETNKNEELRLISVTKGAALVPTIIYNKKI